MAKQTKKTGRNKVFQPDDSGVPTMNMPGAPVSNVMKDDFGLEIPYESVPLPSLGICYPDGHPLHNCETVEIRPMTAREEDILTSRALIKKGTVITHLLESCMVDKSIRANDLIVGDRNALMIALRITGYGADYKAEIQCPECTTTTKYEFDLSEMPINRLGATPDDPGENSFTFELPYTKKIVKFKFLTGTDEEELQRTEARRKKMGQLAENNITTRLEHAITSIAGITDRSKINNFIRNMPARDSRMLRKYIDEIEPGIDLTAWFDCPSCGEGSELGVPLGVSFFWPDAE
jgi:hypothetical protein